MLMPTKYIKKSQYLKKVCDCITLTLNKPIEILNKSGILICQLRKKKFIKLALLLIGDNIAVLVR